MAVEMIPIALISIPLPIHTFVEWENDWGVNGFVWRGRDSIIWEGEEVVYVVEGEIIVIGRRVVVVIVVRVMLDPPGITLPVGSFEFEMDREGEDGTAPELERKKRDATDWVEREDCLAWVGR
jgi:hypothetical protein